MSFSKPEHVVKPLETPAELADRVGVPVSNIRHLIKSGALDHLFTSPGKRNPKIPVGAWERYVENCMIRASYTSGHDERKSR